METKAELLKQQLNICQSHLKKGYSNMKTSDIRWLNDFCAECLKFSNILQSLIAQELEDVDGIEPIETSFLCLTQIVCCIKHLERSIKAEEAGGATIPASRQHFLDRINFCLGRLRAGLRSLAVRNKNETQRPLDEQTFVQLMDLVLEHLTPFSAYEVCNENSYILNNKSLNITNRNNDLMCQSKQIRNLVDLILGHTLAFANVAIKQDKKALSALCQKVLRECCTFQDECNANQIDFKVNDCNRKLKAMSLENALYQLEDFINEALLRLVFTCFVDFDKFSIEKLRSTIRGTKFADVTVVDELIADFDVNLDRSTQIGIFAIAFAPNLKMKTIVRSCLASFESLDTCLVPSLQTRVGDIHSEILEQHFNEEVSTFKNALQEIIDTHAFISCYRDLLSDCITTVEKKYQKSLLEEIHQMGVFLHEHFQFSVNRNVIDEPEYPERRQYFDQFSAILRECRAILCCADQVDSQRILKRFKILRNVLRKLHESLNDTSNRGTKHNGSNVFLMSDEINDNQRMFESAGISPSICSILYSNEKPKRNARKISDSLKGNYSKLPGNNDGMGHDNVISSTGSNSKTFDQKQNLQFDALQLSNQRCSVRRKESLRTAMFKRQNVADGEKLYNAYKLQSANTQISDILDQLTHLSSGFTANARSIELVAAI